MLTGLEAYTTYCKWYPDQNSIPNRIVKGFYILTDMPYIGRNHRGIIKHLELFRYRELVDLAKNVKLECYCPVHFEKRFI